MTNMTNEIQDMASEMQSFQNFFVQIYHRLFCNIVYADFFQEHYLKTFYLVITYDGKSLPGILNEFPAGFHFLQYFIKL